MSIIKANGAGDQSLGFYNGAVSTSLRFNRASAHYLSRDQGSASSSGRKVFTLSFWVKRGILSVADTALFGVQTDGSNRVYMRWEADDTFKVYFAIGGTAYDSGTTMKFRDVSAWYHVAVVVNMSGSGDTGKLKIYVNGVNQTVTYGSTLPDSDTAMNSGAVETLGKKDGANNYMDGYLADVYLIDGTAIGETSGYLDEFGEVKNGVWIPKAYSGSYGTNGFHLEFTSSAHDAPASEGSADTDNIGADSSGQNHHWTAVDSISADDCNMPDSPENNFSTLLASLSEGANEYQSYNKGTYSDGSLKVTGSSSGWTNGKNNFLVNSGKWYAEVTVNAWVANNYVRIGVFARPARTYDEYFWLGNGTAQIDATSVSSKVGSFALNDVLQIAIDLENNNIFFGKNNTWENSATESEIEAGTSTNAFASGSEVPTGDGHYYGIYGNPHSTGTNISFNFGQDPTFAGVMDSSTSAKTPSNSGAGTADSEGNGKFFFAPPSGFLALCSANLSDDNIPISPAQTTQADNYFGTLIWSGDSNNTRKIATGESGVTGTVDFTPDWSWIKTRNGGANGNDHLLLDIVRGVDSFNGLTANDGQIEGLTEAGSTWFNFGDINNFETGGFTVQKGTDASHTLEGINLNSHTYVGWNWKLGGAPSADNSESAGATPTAGSVKIDGSNLGSALAGSIAATRLSANTTAGTSIVTYTGTGSNATVAHGLSSAPDVVMVKRRTGGTGFWSYWGTQFSATTDYIYLNVTAAEDTGGATITNSTLPASTVFSIGTSEFVNASSDTYVAYCFHSVEGYSRFGTYTGNGDNDGTFVYLGFRPSFIMTKRSVGGTSDWIIQDSVRQTFNPSDAWLRPNSIAVEGTTSPDLDLDFVSNGFKIRNNGTNSNINGSTYIYMAFGETFKYANAR